MSAAAPAQGLNRLLPLVKWLPGDPRNIVSSAPAPVPSGCRGRRPNAQRSSRRPSTSHRCRTPVRAVPWTLLAAGLAQGQYEPDAEAEAELEMW